MKNFIIFFLVLVIVILASIMLKTEPEPIEVQDIVVEDVQEDTVAPFIEGKWQSTMDDKSVVVFNEDGSTSDIYDEEELSGGTWEIYQNEEAEYNPSGYFLKTTINEEVYEYVIISATESVLSLSYLDRGNTLEYVKITE